MNFDKSKIELNIIDLVKTVLSKWKIILLLAITFSIIVGCFGWMKSKNTVVDNEKELNELRATLSNEELTAVDNSAKIINSYRDLYNQQKQYNDNSVLQTVNAYSIDTVILTYYVDNYYQITYPVIEKSDNTLPIIDAYTSALSDNTLYEKMSLEINEEIAPNYYQELVDTDLENVEKGVFSVKIYANNLATAQEISDFIKDSLKNKSESIEESFGSHNLVLTSEVSTTSIDTDVVVLQQQNIARETTLSQAILAEENQYLGAQLAYLKALVHEKTVQKTNVVGFIAVGFALGFLLGIIFYMVKYIFSDTIKLPLDLKKVFGLNVFDDQDNNMLITKIKLYLKNSDFNSLVFVKGGVKDTSFIELLTNELSQNGISVLIIDDLTNDPNSIESLSDCDACMLIEYVKQSTYSDVYKKCTLCEHLGITVIGVIIR